MQPRDRDEVIGRGLADLGDGRARRPEDAGDGSPHRADPLREDPRDVVRANVVLPVAEGLLAQERPAADRLADRRERALVVGRGDPAVRGGVDRLVGGVVGDLVDEGPEARERSGQRARRELDAGLAVRAQVRDPVRHRLDGRRDQRLARGFDLPFGHADDLEGVGPSHRHRRRRPRALASRPGQAGLGEQPLDVVEHLAPVVSLRREAIHDHDEGQATLADPAQDQPRDAVRVAGRGRHEQAQVGRLDELIRELPVGVLDAVDVGRVDERETGGQVRVGLVSEALRLDAGQRALAQARRIVRMGEHDGRPGRRPQDAGRTRRTAGDRVEERALAGTGRAEQEHDQRRIQAPGADPDVAGQVVAKAGGPGSGGVGRRAASPSGERQGPRAGRRGPAGPPPGRRPGPGRGHPRSKDGPRPGPWRRRDGRPRFRFRCRRSRVDARVV